VKLLLDEHLSREVAEALRQRGHDVVAVTERREWVQLSDDAPIEVAQAEHRAIVTNNLRDYRPRAAARVIAGSGHYGMVYVPGAYRRRRRDTGRIVSALEDVLRAHPGEDGLRNGETWLPWH
jgi:NADPH-dependent 2,4-dienoyl-CoA reductase/sulfur reductase-like enzyme